MQVQVNKWNTLGVGIFALLNCSFSLITTPSSRVGSSMGSWIGSSMSSWIGSSICSLVGSTLGSLSGHWFFLWSAFLQMVQCIFLPTLLTLFTWPWFLLSSQSSQPLLSVSQFIWHLWRSHDVTICLIYTQDSSWGRFANNICTNNLQILAATVRALSLSHGRVCAFNFFVWECDFLVDQMLLYPLNFQRWKENPCIFPSSLSRRKEV